MAMVAHCCPLQSKIVKLPGCGICFGDLLSSYCSCNEAVRTVPFTACMQEGSEKECQFMDAVLALMVSTLRLGIAIWKQGLGRCERK
jgi:hypothetical protein